MKLRDNYNIEKMSVRKCLQNHIYIYSKGSRDWIKEIHYRNFGLQLRICKPHELFISDAAGRWWHYSRAVITSTKWQDSI